MPSDQDDDCHDDTFGNGEIDVFTGVELGSIGQDEVDTFCDGDVGDILDPSEPERDFDDDGVEGLRHNDPSELDDEGLHPRSFLCKECDEIRYERRQAEMNDPDFGVAGWCPCIDCRRLDEKLRIARQAEENPPMFPLPRVRSTDWLRFSFENVSLGDVFNDHGEIAHAHCTRQASQGEGDGLEDDSLLDLGPEDFGLDPELLDGMGQQPYSRKGHDGGVDKRSWKRGYKTRSPWQWAEWRNKHTEVCRLVNQPTSFRDPNCLPLPKLPKNERRRLRRVYARIVQEGYELCLTSWDHFYENVRIDCLEVERVRIPCTDNCRDRGNKVEEAFSGHQDLDPVPAFTLPPLPQRPQFEELGVVIIPEDEWHFLRSP